MVEDVPEKSEVGVAPGLPCAKKKSESPVTAMAMNNSSLELQLQDKIASQSEVFLGEVRPSFDNGALIAHQDEALYVLTGSKTEDLVQIFTSVKEKQTHTHSLFRCLKEQNARRRSKSHNKAG